MTPQEITQLLSQDAFRSDVSDTQLTALWDAMWQHPTYIFPVLTDHVKRMVDWVSAHATQRDFGWTDRTREPLKCGYVLHLDTLCGRYVCGYRHDWEEGDPPEGEDEDSGCDHPDNTQCGECGPRDCPIADNVSDRKELAALELDDGYHFYSDGDDGEYTNESEWMELHTRPLDAMVENVWLGFRVASQADYEEKVRLVRPLRYSQNFGPHGILFAVMDPALGIEFRIPHYIDSPADRAWSPLDEIKYSDGGGEMNVPTLNWIFAKEP